MGLSRYYQVMSHPSSSPLVSIKRNAYHDIRVFSTSWFLAPVYWMFLQKMLKADIHYTFTLVDGAQLFSFTLCCTPATNMGLLSVTSVTPGWLEGGLVYGLWCACLWCHYLFLGPICQCSALLCPKMQPTYPQSLLPQPPPSVQGLLVPAPFFNWHRSEGLQVRPHNLTQRSGTGSMSRCWSHSHSTPPPPQNTLPIPTRTAASLTSGVGNALWCLAWHLPRQSKCTTCGKAHWIGPSIKKRN